MGRPKRIIQTEFPYHITTRTNNQTFRFHKKQIIKIYATVINKAMEKYKVKVFHFVLMANHYHMIVHITEENLHTFFQFVSSRVALLYNKKMGRSGHLWGDRYRSTIISTDEHYLKCVRYMYMNPVRAGVVTHPGEWNESTFSFHAFGKKMGIHVVNDNFLIMVTNSSSRKVEYQEEFINLFSEKQSIDIDLKKELRKKFLDPTNMWIYWKRNMVYN